MHKVLKSQLKEFQNFDFEVQRFIDKLHNFAYTTKQPRPVAHPLIESILTRIQEDGKPDRYVANYEIVDDDEPKREMAPQPLPPTLEDKKSALMGKLMAAEEVATSKIISPRKRRLLSLMQAEILIKAERSEEDKQFLKEVEVINDSFKRIGRKAAEAASEIDDLTEDNIDQWQVPEL